MIQKLKFPLALCFGILSAYLLRDSFVGLSWVVFFFILIGSHFTFKRVELDKYKSLKLALFGICLISMLIYGNGYTLLLCFITYMAAVADSTGRITGYFVDFIFSFGQMLRGSSQYFKLSPKVSSSQFFKNLRMVLIPTFLLLLFMSFYTSGNQFFGKAVGNAFSWIGEFFEELFSVFDFQWCVLFGFGVFLLSAAINKVKPGFLIKMLDDLPLDLKRQRKVKSIQKSPAVKKHSNLALNQEKKTGIIALVSLNLLLLVANSFDFLNLYTSLSESAVSYSRFVHEGTTHLIFAIALAALVILFYFRGNLNFFRENGLLKKLAYFWIFQNLILAINVAIRNVHYVNFTHALTDKRIGVFIFLIMVIIGLVTLYIKVNQKKTLVWLIKMNSFCIVSILCVSQLVNWERAMIAYNFSVTDKSRIDMNQLFNEIDYDLVYLDQKIRTTAGLRYYYRGKDDAYAYWSRLKSEYYAIYDMTSIKFWTWHKHKNLEKLKFESAEHSANSHYN